MKNGIRYWATGALLTVAACAAESPREESEPLNDLSLQLTLPDGQLISSLSYLVSGGPGAVSRSATIDVNNSSTLRFRVGDLPVGSGYTMQLTALTGTGNPCVSSATFAIVDNDVTSLTMTLFCGGGSLPETDERGDIQVGVDVQQGGPLSCPVATGISLLPVTGTLGAVLPIEGFASSAPDSVLWTTPVGTFGSASSRATTYTCVAAGEHVLTFAVQKAGCVASQYTATVSCVGTSAPNLVWNEVESNGGTPDDWSELYNAGSETVQLGGYTFRDNDDTHVYTIPGGTTIAPGGYLVLENYGFGLGAADSVRLFDPSGTLVLSYSWTSHAPTTYGRCPNLTGELGITTAATKGTANNCAPSVTLNEIESSGGSPDDWIEIYNTGFTTADLAGFLLSDNDDTHMYMLPPGSLVAPGAYLVVEAAALGFGLGGADSVRLYNPDMALVDSYVWTSHAPTTYGRCPNAQGSFAATSQSTKGAANVCSAVVRVNEIESSGGSPGDWVELYNASAQPVDLSGWSFRDNDDTHNYVLPAGTTIAASGFLVLEEAALDFGLGAGDSARLFNASGVAVDSYVWTAHAGTTYGRCPDGSGEFATTATVTKGTPNDCTSVLASIWPGASAVQSVDPANSYPSNLSGLHYQPASGAGPAVLWASLNGPSKVYRLVKGGTEWLPDAGDWSTGKLLRYPDGTGEPDSESVTKAEWDAPGLYVATERNNVASGVSRLSVLRFDETQTGPQLLATNEWNLTGQLPVVGANLGLEAITWIPDSHLLARGFFDTRLAKLYAPSDYPNHGAGLFVVGVEGTGNLHVLALDHVANTGHVLATFSGRQASVMGLEFDRDQGVLWVACDDTCANQVTLFSIDEAPASATRGQFVLRSRIAPPSGLPLSNHEGIALQTATECSAGEKGVFWSDDSNLASHALRAGSVSCGPLF